MFLFSIITARKRSMGQGNVFTPVCHSVQGEGADPPVGRPGGWSLPLDADPFRCRYVNKRVVRILLECILVDRYILSSEILTASSDQDN